MCDADSEWYHLAQADKESYFSDDAGAFYVGLFNACIDYFDGKWIIGSDPVKVAKDYTAVYFGNDYESYLDWFEDEDEVRCIDITEVERLAAEWCKPIDALMNQLHEATAFEIEEYGVYHG